MATKDEEINDHCLAEGNDALWKSNSKTGAACREYIFHFEVSIFKWNLKYKNDNNDVYHLLGQSQRTWNEIQTLNQFSNLDLWLLYFGVDQNIHWFSRCKVETISCAIYGHQVRLIFFSLTSGCEYNVLTFFGSQDVEGYDLLRNGETNTLIAIGHAQECARHLIIWSF